MFGNALYLTSNDVGADVVFGLNPTCAVLQQDSTSFFQGAQAALTALSTSLGALTNTGTIIQYTTVMTLNGSFADIEVFNVNGVQLLQMLVLRIQRVSASATIIINVAGSGTTLGSLVGFESVDLSNLLPWSTRIIWNFYQATQLVVRHVEVQGLLLAPLAFLNQPEGQINGQAMVGSWLGAINVIWNQFSGCTPTAGATCPNACAGTRDTQSCACICSASDVTCNGQALAATVGIKVSLFSNFPQGVGYNAYITLTNNGITPINYFKIQLTPNGACFANSIWNVQDTPPPVFDVGSSTITAESPTYSGFWQLLPGRTFDVGASFPECTASQAPNIKILAAF